MNNFNVTKDEIVSCHLDAALCKNGINQRPKVIVDVDGGADDAFALLLLFAADAKKLIDILAVTCVHGNTTINNVCINVLRLLEALNRSDIPVFQGAAQPLIPTEVPVSSPSYQFHGVDGFGDIHFPESPSIRIKEQENAIEALNRISSSVDGGQVSLICLGPLTNIALAIKTYPAFAENLKEIFIMGGNFTGVGNATSAAEFNFYKDPEAAFIVLACSQCPVTLVPWETCLKAEFSLDWRLNVLGAIDNKHMKLMNLVDQEIYKRAALSEWYPCDAVVAAIFLQHDSIVKSRKCHISVELHGHCTRGQVVVDHLGTNKPNVRLIEEVDIGVLRALLLWAAGHPIQAEQQ